MALLGGKNLKHINKSANETKTFGNVDAGDSIYIYNFLNTNNQLEIWDVIRVEPRNGTAFDYHYDNRKKKKVMESAELIFVCRKHGSSSADDVHSYAMYEKCTWWMNRQKTYVWGTTMKAIDEARNALKEGELK